jgi:tetratricopeptide (TPR) repeat protein
MLPMTMFSRSAALTRNLINLLVGRLPPPSETSLRNLAGRDRKPAISLSDEGASPVEQGRLAFSEGRHSEALALFSAAIEEDPENAWAWHGRGDALQMMEGYGEALTCYSKAAALCPGRGIHHAGRANALRGEGRASEAEEAWQKALGLDPTLGWMRGEQGC